ncbi:hypothetical protein MPH_11421 [Macrophomina phaseolina MS6]|uniref:Uncharacterized protein n=1 Tax=Macrophomina phaseolina (strain MS6) TaxID=1126212 RepID=K2QN86_MACPH|nr:hypothetical protein MPH_11421 [Macrophomina phaseolina MS6]
MPAVRFSASPPPRPPPLPPGTSCAEEAPAQPVRSALAHPEQSLEATFGLIFQSQHRRYAEQDASPPQHVSQSHPPGDITALKRRSNPSRPARPTSAALQGAQAYLDATIKPSIMRLKDVEAWVEDSLHAQAMYGITPSSPSDPPAPSPRRWSDKARLGVWPSFDKAGAAIEGKDEADDKPLRRMKSSSFSSVLGKKLVRTPSDFMNWFKSPSAQGSTPRSRSISQLTDSNEGEQAAHDRRWSTSSRHRMLRLSDGSQRAPTAPSTSPTYRSVFNGLHRRFHSTDSSDSSWSSFGCVDGMRRPDTGADVAEGANGDKSAESVVQVEGETAQLERAFPKEEANQAKKTMKDSRRAEDAKAPDHGGVEKETKSTLADVPTKEVNPVKQALKKIVSRMDVPLRPAKPYLESDTACMMPY